MNYACIGDHHAPRLVSQVPHNKRNAYLDETLVDLNTLPVLTCHKSTQCSSHSARLSEPVQCDRQLLRDRSCYTPDFYKT